MLPGTQTPRSVAPSQLYKEPPCFAGTASEDVDEWLKQYKRVSKLNGWDSAAQLSHVVLSLTNTALLWYDNHEDTLTTWEIFEEELKKCFGDSITKKKRAEQTLSQRAQLQGETCTMYIEEILKLCRLVNPSMSEEDKVGHLLKGIAEDVYQFLIAKENLTSVAEVMQHCRTFEALKMRRIAPKFGRLANVPTVASVEACSPFDLSSTIRQIVREELLRCHEISRFGGDDSRGNEPGLPPMSWQPSVNAADVDNYQAVPQSGPARRPRFVSTASSSAATLLRRRGCTLRMQRRGCTETTMIGTDIQCLLTEPRGFSSIAHFGLLLVCATAAVSQVTSPGFATVADYTEKSPHQHPTRQIIDTSPRHGQHVHLPVVDSVKVTSGTRHQPLTAA